MAALVLDETRRSVEAREVKRQLERRDHTLRQSQEVHAESAPRASRFALLSKTWRAAVGVKRAITSASVGIVSDRTVSMQDLLRVSFRLLEQVSGHRADRARGFGDRGNQHVRQSQCSVFSPGAAFPQEKSETEGTVMSNETSGLCSSPCAVSLVEVSKAEGTNTSKGTSAQSYSPGAVSHLEVPMAEGTNTSIGGSAQCSLSAQFSSPGAALPVKVPEAERANALHEIPAQRSPLVAIRGSVGKGSVGIATPQVVAVTNTSSPGDAKHPEVVGQFPQFSSTQQALNFDAFSAVGPPCRENCSRD